VASLWAGLRGELVMLGKLYILGSDRHYLTVESTVDRRVAVLEKHLAAFRTCLGLQRKHLPVRDSLVSTLPNESHRLL
jgi:hypothetical protein